MIPADRRDFILMSVFAASAAVGALVAGPMQNMPLPAWMFIPVLLLFAIAGDARKREYPDRPFLALFPVVFAGILTIFCLLTQMPVKLWAFIIPNRFPLAIIALWAVSVPILLHPVAERGFYGSLWKAARALGRRGYWTTKVWITIPIILLFLWLFHSQNLSPDGYDWLVHSIHPRHWIRYLREPLGTLVFRGATLIGIWIGAWPPLASIALTTYLCGFATVAILWPTLGYLAPEKDERLLWLLALLSSGGFTQLFIGNIEIYAVLMVAFAGFLYFGIAYLHSTRSAAAVGISFAVLFATHLSAGWWIPAFLLLPYLRYRIQAKRTDLWIRDTASIVGIFAICIVSFALWMLWYGYGGDAQAMWEHFWGPQVMQVGADGAMFRTASEIASPNTILTMVNEYFHLSPILCGLVLYFVCRPFRPRIGSNEIFLGLLAGFYFVYSIVWRPDRKFPQDWDIFSGLTLPALFFLLLCFRRRMEDKATWLFLVRPLITFSGSLAILHVLYNNLRVSSWPLPN